MGVPVDTRALDDAARLVGDRWSLLVVGALLENDRTFGELERAITGIAASTLSARLRALHHDGLVTVHPYAVRPVRLRYSLTEPGRRLADALASLAAWGARRSGRPVPAPDAAGDDHEGEDGEELVWC